MNLLRYLTMTETGTVTEKDLREKCTTQNQDFILQDTNSSSKLIKDNCSQQRKAQVTEATKIPNPTNEGSGDGGYGNVGRTECTKRAHPYEHLSWQDASLADVLGNDYQQFNGGSRCFTHTHSSYGDINFDNTRGIGLNNMFQDHSLGLNGSLTEPKTMGCNLRRDMFSAGANRTTATNSTLFGIGYNGSHTSKQQDMLNVLTSKMGDLELILQSRAKLYGDSLHPE